MDVAVRQRSSRMQSNGHLCSACTVCRLTLSMHHDGMAHAMRFAVSCRSAAVPTTTADDEPEEEELPMMKSESQ